LKRAIQKELETPLGKLLLKGEVSDGQKVVVDREGAPGALKFIVKPGEASKPDAAAAA
jgi:ATP-dependent Clp protease ATP-binding subunit ClpB